MLVWDNICSHKKIIVNVECIREGLRWCMNGPYIKNSMLASENYSPHYIKIHTSLTHVVECMWSQQYKIHAILHVHRTQACYIKTSLWSCDFHAQTMQTFDQIASSWRRNWRSAQDVIFLQISCNTRFSFPESLPLTVYQIQPSTQISLPWRRKWCTCQLLKM